MRAIAAAAFSSAMLFAGIAAAQNMSSAAAPATAPAPAAAPAAPAVAPTAAPAATATASAVNLDEVVCRTQPPPIGSRFGGGQECHTVRQWRQREHDSQDILARQQFTSGPQPGQTGH